MFAGGFADSGGEGVALQNELGMVCRDVGFTLCGPNCIGIINAATPVTATFAAALSEFDTLRAGPISMVTQSGGIGSTIFSMVQRAGFGFRHLISSGNEAVVRFADYLYALARDDGTRIIAAYLEAHRGRRAPGAGIGGGSRPGQKDRVDQGGATRASAPGTMVGEDHIFDAILQEFGVIRVRSVEELVDVCLMLAGTEAAKLPHGRGVGIVAFDGGDGVLAADQCAAHGLTVPKLASASVKRPRPRLVSAAANPMVLTPTASLRSEFAGATSRRYGCSGRAAGHRFAAGHCRLAGCARGGDQRQDHRICPPLRQAGVGRVGHRRPRARWSVSPPPASSHSATPIAPCAGSVAWPRTARCLRDRGRAAAVAMPSAWELHVEPGMTVVTEDLCHTIMIDAGLPVAPGRLAIDAAAALPIAHEIGFPVALKAISSKVTHRAAAGLLAIDLRNAEEVLANFRRLEDRARANDIVLDGIYVQKMQRGGVELLVSVFRDPVFGTMVSCGGSGGLAELIDDVVTARAPVTEAVAVDMVERLRCRGAARDGQGLLDAAAPAAFIARLSQLGASAPWRKFTFEINPIKWTRAGVVAVDGLLVID